MLELLTTVLTVRIMYWYFFKRKEEKKIPIAPATTPAPSTKKVAAYDTWLDEWISRHDLKVKYKHDDKVFCYHLAMMLKTSFVELEVELQKSNNNVHINILFPILIDDRFFPRLNILITEFNAGKHPYSLYLDKNYGTLRIYVDVPGEYIHPLDSDGKADVLRKMFLQSDAVFTETMRVVYGNAMPEIAVMKMVGQNSIQLN